jgi:uncharacterized protein
MIKYFVFDTNVLISAHLKEGSTSDLAYQMALTIGVIVLSDDTRIEFETRLDRKKFDKYLSPENRAEAILRMNRGSLLVNPTISIKACRDPDDDMFLSLALTLNASCLITRDKDLLVLHPFRGIPILTPAQFLKSF